MRATEFVINIPINIKINGDGEPEVDVSPEETNNDEAPVTVFPLQQELELEKAKSGKKSRHIDDLVSPDKSEEIQ